MPYRTPPHNHTPISQPSLCPEPATMSDDRLDEREGTAPEASAESETIADAEELVADLDELAADTESAAAVEEIRELEGLMLEARERGLVDSGVRRLQVSDAVEAFVGSVIFGSPLLVEDGVFDIAVYLFDFTIAGIPLFLVANTLFVVVMTYALVEWTGRDREETQVLFGVVPVRVVMILVISFLVAAGLMTIWGRVGGWQAPSEAIARINVIWTVASLGAALGDIISEPDAGQPDGIPAGSGRGGDSPTAETDTPRPPTASRLTDAALFDAIIDQFAAIETLVDDQAERRDVERIRDRTSQAALDDGFGDRIRKYTTRDIAEGFVGSIFFSIPFLVEDGVFDVANYFLSFRLGTFPVFFVLNTAFILLMVTTLVYWAGPQDVQVTRPLFGFVPRRMVGIAAVSFLTAAALMTMWGRVENWQTPVVAIARISVVWTVAAFGAALGDILPGESSGDDINDDIAELGEFVEEFID